MTEQQTNLLVLILTILLNSGILTTLVIAAKRAIEQRLGPERARVAADIASQAVLAVEQVSQARGWTNQERKRLALEQARNLAAAHGITLTDEQWHTLIEASVNVLSRTQDELTALTAAPAVT